MEVDPAFQELFMGQVDAHLAKRVYERPAYRDFRARLPLRLAPVLTEAAAAREMSVSAYLRRAGLAFAAYDLDLDLAQLLEDEPPILLRFAPPSDGRRMAGSGHGKWRIGGLQ